MKMKNNIMLKNGKYKWKIQQNDEKNISKYKNTPAHDEGHL